MWTTEAWMPYPPTGEITGSQPRVGCRHVTCRTVRVWWWNFPETPASQNHWLCLGGIFRDGSRPRATCGMITWGLTYISSAWFGVREFPPTWTFFYRDWKYGAWSVHVISSCKIKVFFDSPELNIDPCCTVFFSGSYSERSFVNRLSERLFVKRFEWMLFENKDVNLKFGGLAVKLFS